MRGRDVKETERDSSVLKCGFVQTQTHVVPETWKGTERSLAGIAMNCAYNLRVPLVGGSQECICAFAIRWEACVWVRLYESLMD